MKIAYIVPSLAATAPVFIAKRLSDYFLSKGNEVEVFYFDAKYGTDFKCNTTQIKMNKPIDFDSFDIIHSHMMRPDKYIARFSNQIKKAKTISTIHCNLNDLRFSFGNIISFIYVKKWLNWLRHFDCTVQINDYLLNLYKIKLPNSCLIYNGISISPEQDDYSDIENKIKEFKKQNLSVLCSYSGIDQRKGLRQILELLKIRSDLSYICIGNGPQKNELIKFALKNGISNRVYFSPFKKNPYYVMKYADVFMIPSFSEGFSLALLESGNIGSSVVCSDIPAFNLPFSTNEVSFFELGNIESLSSAVNEALKYKVQKKTALLKKVEEHFSEQIMFEKYEKQYSALVNRCVIGGECIAILITYNPTPTDLQNVISSLLPQVEKIIIVDNGSTNIDDFSFPAKVELIKLNENEGIAKATNIGLKRGIELKADFVITSDQDSVYPDDYVENFLKAYSKYDEKNIAAYVPVFYEKNSQEIKPVYVKKHGFIKKVQQKNDVHFVYQAIASGMIIKVSSLQSVGFMNEDLFIDSVDFEWGWRAAYCGKKILSIMNLKLTHSLGDKNQKILKKDVSVHSVQRYYYITRNTAYLSFHSPYISFSVRLQLFAKSILYIFGYSVLSKEHIKTYRILVKAFFDGMNKRLGKK